MKQYSQNNYSIRAIPARLIFIGFVGIFEFMYTNFIKSARLVNILCYLFWWK
jgi:hypothetical protein